MKKINCILLIDDNQDDNGLHNIKIRKADICNHVETVTGGREALDYLRGSFKFPKPELIFLDINMPGMNAYEFLEEYTKLDSGLKAKIVIVMLSTSLNPGDLERAMATKEVTEFQNKPLTVAILQKITEKYF